MARALGLGDNKPENVVARLINFNEINEAMIFDLVNHIESRRPAIEFTGRGRTPFKRRRTNHLEKHPDASGLRCNDLLTKKRCLSS